MNYSPFHHIGSVLKKSDPIQLTLFLTKRCNSRCPFCFYLSKESEIAKDELTLDEIKKISSSMGDLLWLAFSGGEIFLRDDIVEITEVFYKNNKPSIILFPTNGLLTDTIVKKTGAILEKCPKSSIAVKLSVEGTEKLHDSIRGKGSFRKTMKTFTELGRLLDSHPNFDLGINTVFCSANQDSMERVIDFVSELDSVRTHTVSLIRGDAADKKLKDVDIDKYLNAIKKLESNLKDKTSKIYRFRGARLKAAQDILQRRLIYDTFMQKEQLIPCYAGKLNLVITETGDVYPCESFDKKMGNVRQDGYDMRKILDSEQARKVIASIKEKSCYCTHECYMMTNILFNPKMYPALLKEYMHL
ncbi:MAG: radical SAM protein [Nitrospirae bacterium]|nr:radical SAM protein [Nitrospirota bacterium]